MNKKVWITLLILLISCLVAYTIIEFVFPETFIMVLTDTNILKIGNFIEERAWLYEIVCYVTSFITFYLFGCISKEKWHLKFYETLIVIALVVCSQLLYVYVPQVGVMAGIIPMLLVGVIIGNRTKLFLGAFIGHNICQYLVLFVRGYNEVLPTLNAGSDICMLLENYVLLFVFYIISNIKEKKNEQNESTNN